MCVYGRERGVRERGYVREVGKSERGVCVREGCE